MKNHLSSLRSRGARADAQQISFDQWLESFQYAGVDYPLGMLNQTSPGGKTQEILPTYSSLAVNAMRGNGIVWACIVARMMLFSEASFQFRRLGSITSGDLYGTQALSLLETPWPGSNTRKMLSLMDLHAQVHGNAYAYRDPNPNTPALRVARPDWMTIVLGSRQPPRPDFQVWDIDTEIIGYIYRPNGLSAPAEQSKMMLPEQVAHFMPIPDPMWHFRGMSWLQPVVKEIIGDTAMTEHKNRFLENGATANLVITMDPATRKEEFEAFVERFDDGHQGSINAYKTIYLAGGADAKVVGANMQQVDFRSVQAHGETRICNAAGIPPIIVGVSEGLDSATYSNYAQARRAWADAQLRPLWAGMSAELGQIIDVPAGSELWYDERKIAFLQEDMQDQASIMSTQAATMRNLTDAGWTPESAVAYLETGDLGKLVHTGLYSVQLQPPGVTLPNISTQPLTPRSPVPGPAQETAPAPTPDAPATSPAAPAAVLCSLCHEPAASNAHRCPKCNELHGDLYAHQARTVARVAEQLGISEHEAAVALGVKKARPPRLIVNGEPKDHLTPALNGNGRL